MGIEEWNEQALIISLRLAGRGLRRYSPVPWLCFLAASLGWLICLAAGCCCWAIIIHVLL